MKQQQTGWGGRFYGFQSVIPKKPKTGIECIDNIFNTTQCISFIPLICNGFDEIESITKVPVTQLTVWMVAWKYVFKKRKKEKAYEEETNPKLKRRMRFFEHKKLYFVNQSHLIDFGEYRFKQTWQVQVFDRDDI